MRRLRTKRAVIDLIISTAAASTPPPAGLNFGRSGLGDEGVVMLAQALRVKTKPSDAFDAAPLVIRTPRVALSVARLTAASVAPLCAIFHSGVFPAAEALCISGNALGGEGTVAVITAALGSAPQLVEVEAADCGVDDVAFLRLAAIAATAGVTRLNLGWSALTDAGCASGAKAMRGCGGGPAVDTAGCPGVTAAGRALLSGARRAGTFPAVPSARAPDEE